MTEAEIDTMLEYEMVIAKDDDEVAAAVDAYMYRMAVLRDQENRKMREC
jgi:hypothetical protein